jgi:HTH-type transcriptional regulator / antitoxin HipB
MHSKLDSTVAVADGIGKIVSRERERLGLRQDELALAAGVSTRVVHQVENGKATSRLDSLIPILEALGVELEVKSRSPQVEES